MLVQPPRPFVPGKDVERQSPEPSGPRPRPRRFQERLADAAAFGDVIDGDDPDVAVTLRGEVVDLCLEIDEAERCVALGNQ
jgi:hypothetical protein